MEIGVSTGNTTIYNDGDIEITVNGNSDLTAENIKSERGDVSVEVQNGSILSAGAGANITGENVSLSASENIGTPDCPVNVEQVEEEPHVTVTVIGKGVAHSETITDPEGNEKTIWVMDVELRYDWARTDDAEATKRLDAEAANGRYLCGRTDRKHRPGNPQRSWHGICPDTWQHHRCSHGCGKGSRNAQHHGGKRHCHFRERVYRYRIRIVSSA